MIATILVLVVALGIIALSIGMFIEEDEVEGKEPEWDNPDMLEEHELKLDTSDLSDEEFEPEAWDGDEQ